MTKPIAFVTGYHDGYPVVQPTDNAAVLPVRMALYDHPAPDVQPVAWTEREIELIDEMIEGQLIHSERLERIPNRAMADKQKGWNMERVILLQKIKSAHPPVADVSELVEVLRRLEEVASDCDIGYMDNAVRHARRVIEKWEGK